MDIVYWFPFCIQEQQSGVLWNSCSENFRKIPGKHPASLYKCYFVVDVLLGILKNYLEQLFFGVDILGDSSIDKNPVSKLFFLIEFVQRNVAQNFFFNELDKLTLSSNQWTGFYMITASVIKELSQSDSQSDSLASLTLVFWFK